MQLLHVKLKNGEDLLTFGSLSKNKETIQLTSPISMDLDPELGIFAKTWLMYSDADTVNIPTEQVMFVNPASLKAIQYYNDFTDKLQGKRTETVNEFEELFETMMEAKASTKH